MKLRLFLIICLAIWHSLNLFAQQEKLINIKLQNVPLSEAFKSIEKESEMHILFDYADIESFRITCKLENMSVEQALSELLADKHFLYKKVRKNTYVIQKSKTIYKNSVIDYELSGFVCDSLNHPIEAAVVSLIDIQTGTSIAQCITSSKGLFNIRASGDIQLYVSCLGFSPYLSDTLQVNKDSFLKIRLHSASIQLEDILVVGEKQTPSVQMNNGNLLFVPKNSGILAGSSALDLLKRTPGVFVDSNENISIGGRNGALVIFNGKSTYMKQEEVVAMLRSMSSTSVTSVEIINNPSAQYDAEGSGGIININTKKQYNEGYSFFMNNGISYWNNIRQNTELSFSYTHNKFNMTGNYHHQFGYYDLDYGMKRIQNGKEYYSPTDDTDKRKTIAGNLDLEYKFNDKNLIGGQLTANTLFGPGKTTTTTEITDIERNELEQILYAQNIYYKQKGNRYGANLYYVSTPKEGVRYTLDANYAWFDGGSGNLQPNIYKRPNGDIVSDLLYKSVNSRNIHIYALAYNQSHKLGKGELKSGLKYSNVNADNSYRFYELKNKQETLDETQSNDFTYKEQILAAYLSYAYPFNEKWNLEIGIRGEQTWSDGRLFTITGINDKENKRSYFDIFPSLGLNYQLSDEQSLSINYGSRIDRPAYQDLNPFEYLLDELSYWKGNPFLTPQKTHRVTAAYSKNKLSLIAAYTYMKDYKAQITDTLSSNKVIMTPRNIGKQQQFSITLNWGVNPTQWWDMNLNMIGYYVNKDIAFDTSRKFKKEAVAGIFTLMNTFRLPLKIQLEINGAFSTKRLGAANEKMDPTGYVDLAIGKSFMHKRLNINLSLSDLFWTNNWDNYSYFPGFKLWNWGKGESRQIKLNLSYRLGKERNKTHQQDFKEIERL